MAIGYNTGSGGGDFSGVLGSALQKLLKDTATSTIKKSQQPSPVNSALGLKTKGLTLGSGGSSGGGGGSGLQALAASAAGGSPGGGGGGGGGGKTTRAGSGAANGYLETGADIFAQNPEAMLAQILDQLYGGVHDNALYAQLAPLADNANMLYFALNGQDAESGTKENFINWLDQFWRQQMQQGQFTDVASALGNILNPQENSPLRSYLGLGTAQDQAGNFERLLSGILATGYHPLFAKSAMNRVDESRNHYLGQAAQGAVDPFYTYAQQAMPYLSRLLGT